VREGFNGAMKILFVYPNILLANRIPLGIAYLSACLKRAGHETFLFDTTFCRVSWAGGETLTADSDDAQRRKTLQVGGEIEMAVEDIDLDAEFTRQLAEIKPELVAMSCHQNTYPLGIAILAIAKRQGCRTIAGGVKVTTAPEEVIADPAVDMICVGEGEAVVVELCRSLEENEDITGIANLWIKQDGKVYKNEIGSPTDLATLPAPDWALFDDRHLLRPMGGKHYRMGFFETSRGCPYACTYCINHKLLALYKGKKFLRTHSLDKVIAEMKEFKQRYRLNYITFNDDLFLDMDIKRLGRFCDLYRADVGLPFFMETRPETIARDKIKLLRAVGLERMAMGIESGSVYIREKVLRRKVSNERMVEAFLIIKAEGINVSTNSIIGIPEETRDHIFETIEINRQIKPNSATVKFLYPYQGTAIYELCRDKGYIDSGKTVSGYQMGSVLTLPQISNEELVGLHRTFQLYCFFPKWMFPLIRMAEKDGTVGNAVFGLLGSLFELLKRKR